MRWLSILWGGVGLLAGASAQPAEETWPVVFTVVAPAPLEDLAYPVYSSEGGVEGWQPLQFFTTGRSLTYRYEGPFPVPFVRREVVELEAEGEARAVVPVASWRPADPAEERWLLFFFPSETAAGGVRLLPLRDGTGGFPRGHLRFFRATGLELACEVTEELSGERHRLRLPLGASGAVPFAGGGRVECRTPFRERWRLSYADRIPLAEDERLVVILLPPFAEGSLHAQATLLRDRPTPARAPAKESADGAAPD
jgi:hypothetical protein